MEGHVPMKKVADGVFEVDINDPTTFAHLWNARTLYQYEHMYKHLQNGKCPFCHLEELRYLPVKRIGNWALKLCDMPYANCEYHLILVYTGGHVTDWSKLSRDDNADFMELINEAERMYNIKGCAVVFRRGEVIYHAGTMTHLHGHIMVVKINEETGLPVGPLRAYFAKSLEEIAYAQKMVGLFERIRTGNITGTRRGYVVFDASGKYLTEKLDWHPINTPVEADFLEVTLDQLHQICAKTEGLQYYEVLSSNETGTVLVDGPTKLAA